MCSVAIFRTSRAAILYYEASRRLLSLSLLRALSRAAVEVLAAADHGLELQGGAVRVLFSALKRAGYYILGYFLQGSAGSGSSLVSLSFSFLVGSLLAARAWESHLRRTL